MGEPTFYLEDATVAIRAVEVPLASFDNGMNLGGSNACGIGINMNEGAIVGTPAQFTLLDQRGDARVPQTSQHIGGDGLGAGTSGTLPDGSVRFGTVSANGDGSMTPIGNSTLNSLAGGWVTNI